MTFYGLLINRKKKIYYFIDLHTDYFLDSIIEKIFAPMNGLNQSKPVLISDITDSNILTNQVKLNKNNKEDFFNFFICSYRFLIK
jgi:hypothetical protein